MKVECTIDAEVLKLMHRLWARGWNVRIWKDGVDDCYAELATRVS